MVIGKVNPLKLRRTVYHKKCKKLRRVSPILPEEDKNKKKEGGSGEERKEKKTQAKTKPKEKPEVTKSNEPGMTTTVVEVHFYCNCEGRTHQIQKVVINTIGNYNMTIDGDKSLVTVTGST